MRICFTLLIVFIHFSVKSQNINDESKSYVIDCKKAADSMYRHMQIDSSKYNYLIFMIERGAPSTSMWRGFVLLKNLYQVSKNERRQLAIQLIKEFKLTTVMFFENCDLVALYYQAMKHTPEQEIRLASGTDFFYSKDIL